MGQVIMMSLVAAALLGGQVHALVHGELISFSAAAPTPLVQLKTGSISGVVTDPNSHAVAGATVTALRKDADDGSTLRSFFTASDTKGYFKFAAVPIGAYEIRVGWDEMWPLVKEIEKIVVVRGSESTTVEFQFQFINECAGPEVQSPSDADKAEMVKWMIQEAITERKTASDSTLSSDKIVVLSTANIESSWVPIVPGYKLVLLTPAEVQLKANREGDYLYWHFDEIRARGSCVAVTISHRWADGTSSLETVQGTPLTESLFIYVFRKQSGRWIGKVMNGSIS